MSAVPILSLHPSTRRSIELQAHANFGVRDCGCETVRNDVALIRLCQYHQGWDDAVDTFNTKETTT